MVSCLSEPVQLAIIAAVTSVLLAGIAAIASWAKGRPLAEGGPPINDLGPPSHPFT